MGHEKHRVSRNNFAPAGLLVPGAGSTCISGSAAGASSDRGSGAVSAMAAAIAGGSWVSGAGPDGVGRLHHSSVACIRTVPPASNANGCWRPKLAWTAGCPLDVTTVGNPLSKTVRPCCCAAARVADLLQTCWRLTSLAAGRWFRPRRGRRRPAPAPLGSHRRLLPGRQPAARAS